MARVAPALVLLSLLGACSAARSTTGTPAATSTPSRHVLPNGVRVIVQEHRASDVAALQLWVRAGSRDETPAELGLAHYLEHMVFKGTAIRAAGFVEREVESVGGRINAATSWDYTFYHTVLPARRAAAGIDLLADIAVNATLDATLLEAEKRVVLEEMRRVDDNPRLFVGRQLYEVVFDGHPYGRPIIGTPAVITSVSRDTLAGFYRRLYVPESFTLVIVGAIDPPAMLQAASATFGRLPRSGLQRLPAPVPPEPRSRQIDMVRAGSHAYLGMAWRGPKIDHADTPAVDLLAAVLGQARSSRLTQSLREQLGIVTSVGATYAALEAAGAIFVTAQLEAAHLARVEDEILREVRRVKEQGITEVERRRAVTAAEAQHEFSVETAEGRARTLGLAETVGRLEDELAYLYRVRSVTAPQILAAARRYLDPERYARLALVPPSAR